MFPALLALEPVQCDRRSDTLHPARGVQVAGSQPSDVSRCRMLRNLVFGSTFAFVRLLGFFRRALTTVGGRIATDKCQCRLDLEIRRQWFLTLQSLTCGKCLGLLGSLVADEPVHL